MQLKPLSGELSVTPQISVPDVASLAELGFRSIIGNRPEGESPDQPSWNALEEAAGQHGLETCHIPVMASAISDADVDAFRVALRDLPKPIAAFCRTGMRSAILWALANGESTTVERIRTAARQGYDLEPFRVRMAQQG